MNPSQRIGALERQLVAFEKTARDLLRSALDLSRSIAAARAELPALQAEIAELEEIADGEEAELDKALQTLDSVLGKDTASKMPDVIDAIMVEDDAPTAPAQPRKVHEVIFQKYVEKYVDQAEDVVGRVSYEEKNRTGRVSFEDKNRAVDSYFGRCRHCRRMWPEGVRAAFRCNCGHMAGPGV